MNYELVYIVSSNLPETEHPAVQEEILAYLSQIKAKIITKPYSLGRKRLAYLINKQKHGFYVALEFSLDDTTGLKKLEIDLKHNKNILRHLIIKKSSVVKAAKETSKRAEPVKVAKPILTSEKEDKTKSPEQQQKEDKPKIDLDDLDQKLDQILKKEQ